MKDFNVVTLSGRLTKDTEVRKTSNNLSVLNFTLAVEQRNKNDKGEYGVDFIDVTVWRSGADFLAQYAQKGDKIGVVGRISTQTYKNDKGESVKRVLVVADEVFILQKKLNNSDMSSQRTLSPGPKRYKEPTVDGKKLFVDEEFGNKNNDIAINTDDLPFY